MTRKSWTRRSKSTFLNSTMKDNELRAIVLQAYYGLRHLGSFQWAEVEENQIPKVGSYAEIARMSEQLAQHGLIEWKPVRGAQGETVGGIGKITAFGVDVIEGTVQSPISIKFDHSQTVTIHGSNNIVGNNNQLSLERVNSEISQSSFSEAEKAEAKSLWQKVSENKLLNTVIGSAVGELTKAALPK